MQSSSSAIKALLTDGRYEPGYGSLVCAIIAQAFDDGLSATIIRPSLRRWRRLYHFAKDFCGVKDWAALIHLNPTIIQRGFDIYGIPTTVDAWLILLKNSAKKRGE